MANFQHVDLVVRRRRLGKDRSTEGHSDPACNLEPGKLFSNFRLYTRDFGDNSVRLPVSRWPTAVIIADSCVAPNVFAFDVNRASCSKIL